MVLSLTMDPRLPGGIATVNHWYDRWMTAHERERTDVYLDELASPFDFIRRARSWRLRNGGMPRLLPHLHIPQYYAGRILLRRRADVSVAEIHIIGAHVVHGAIAAGRREPSLAWFATTLGDERRSVLSHHRSHRRLAYRLSVPWLERLELEVLAGAEKILPMSRHTADQLVGLGLPLERIEILPPPVDVIRFTPGPSPRRGILFVGRAGDPRKNFAAVARLVVDSSWVRDRGVDVVSDRKPRLRAAAGVDGAIRWRGRVDDLPATYRAAQVLVLPSLQEGFGAVVFEALACETPVVAFRCGGPDDFLEASGGGYVVDGESEFRMRVEYLLKDESAAREMGRAGRRWVEENMSTDRFLADASLFTVGRN